MHLSRIASFCVPTTTLAFLLCPSSFADDFAPQDQAREPGHQEYRGQAELDSFRIKRSNKASANTSANCDNTVTTTASASGTQQLYGSVEHRRSPAYSPIYSSLQAKAGSLVQTNDYAAPVESIVTPPAVPVQSKYLWGQSALGGYYEATGQIKELVMGDQLFKYGGKFMDGTVVPTTPVACNFKGHVYQPYVVKRM